MTLFCYGSLEFAEVMRAVTGRSFAHERARLEGWQRRRWKGRSFPALRARKGTWTSGTLWHEIDARSAARLDAFEGEHYERRGVMVRTSAGLASADVYVAAPAWLGEISEEPWDPLRFARIVPEFVRSIRTS